MLRVAREFGVDVLGYPRLTRLNPNIPWKTRGNAALSARLGHGGGEPREVGRIEGRPLLSFPRGSPLSEEEWRTLRPRLWSAVLSTSQLGEVGTDPVMVASPVALPERLYWDAVRERVPIGRVERDIRRLGASAWMRGSHRGVIGASAAIAWPARRRTYELIAYRRPETRGTPRAVDAKSVRQFERSHRGTFLCYDDRTRRLLVAPHTNCPILYGVRATQSDALRAAPSEILSEPVDRWVLFATNQATGDHLVDRDSDGVPPYGSAIVRGEIADAPTLLPGGHVRLNVRGQGPSPLDCLVFEPTKTLPFVARRLRVGDRLKLWGGRGRDPTFRVEGLILERLASIATRLPDAHCCRCQGPLDSLGQGRGFRCHRCRQRCPPESLWTMQERGLKPGVYHPTPSARRHLHPLPRFLRRVPAACL